MNCYCLPAKRWLLLIREPDNWIVIFLQKFEYDDEWWPLSNGYKFLIFFTFTLNVIKSLPNRFSMFWGLENRLWLIGFLGDFLLQVKFTTFSVSYNFHFSGCVKLRLNLITVRLIGLLGLGLIRFELKLIPKYFFYFWVPEEPITWFEKPCHECLRHFCFFAWNVSLLIIFWACLNRNNALSKILALQSWKSCLLYTSPSPRD